VVVLARVRTASIRVVNPAAAGLSLAQDHGQRREREVAIDIPTGRPRQRTAMGKASPGACGSSAARTRPMVS